MVNKHDVRDALHFCTVLQSLPFQLYKTLIFMFLFEVHRSLELALVMYRANVGASKCVEFHSWFILSNGFFSAEDGSGRE